MEVSVRPHRLPEVARGAGLVEVREVPPRGGASGLGEPLGRPADRERLEREPHLEQVAEVVGVEVQDLRALVRNVLG